LGNCPFRKRKLKITDIKRKIQISGLSKFVASKEINKTPTLKIRQNMHNKDSFGMSFCHFRNVSEFICSEKSKNKFKIHEKPFQAKKKPEYRD
jgi:hypothetical protein